MNHFVYEHMPAGGLSQDDPYRPQVTGGIGHAIFLVVFTNVEMGRLELKWYYGNPAGAWAMFIGESIVDLAEPFAIWNISDFTVTPAEPVELLWSTISGNALWSIWSSELRWRFGNPSSSWETDFKMKWSFGDMETWRTELMDV